MLRRGKHAAALTVLNDKGRRFFVVHGAGRSGTQLITSLVNAGAHAAVFHEPDFDDDLRVMPAIHADPDCADAYWKRFRAARIMARWADAPDAKLYGEVTGMIRHHSQTIKTLFPDAPQFLLARHPSGFVRSLMGWTQFYSETSRGAYALSPAPGDPVWADWEGFSRFEKCCWAWAETYIRLAREIDPARHLRLEDIVSDYDSYVARLDQPLGLGLNEATWHGIVATPSKNSTKTYAFATYADWKPEEKEAFARLCGPAMSNLGYAA